MGRAAPAIARRTTLMAALIGTGKRSVKLNAASLKVARAIGPIQLGSDDRDCEPLDIVKH